MLHAATLLAPVHLAAGMAVMHHQRVPLQLQQ